MSEHRPPTPPRTDAPTADDAYLWDRSAPVDPFVADLERTLAPLAHRGGRLEAARGREGVRARGLREWRWVAIVSAALAVVLGGTLLVLQRQHTPALPAPAAHEGAGWTVTGTGFTTSEGPPVTTADGVRPSTLVATDSGRTAALTSALGSVIEVAPGTRVGLVHAGGLAQRLVIESGTLFVQASVAKSDMHIASAAGEVTVSPGAACMVRVSEGGAGRVEVKTGQVRIDRDGVQARVAAQCAVALSARGPGTPVRSDAPRALAEVLAKLDDLRAPADAASMKMADDLLGKALSVCTQRDQATLWNLAQRATPGQRKQVIARAMALSTVVHKADTDALMRADAAAMDVWWSMIAAE